MEGFLEAFWGPSGSCLAKGQTATKKGQPQYGQWGSLTSREPRRVAKPSRPLNGTSPPEQHPIEKASCGTPMHPAVSSVTFDIPPNPGTALLDIVIFPPSHLIYAHQNLWAVALKAITESICRMPTQKRSMPGVLLAPRPACWSY